MRELFDSISFLTKKLHVFFISALFELYIVWLVAILKQFDNVQPRVSIGQQGKLLKSVHRSFWLKIIKNIISDTTINVSPVATMSLCFFLHIVYIYQYNFKNGPHIQYKTILPDQPIDINVLWRNSGTGLLPFSLSKYISINFS